MPVPAAAVASALVPAGPSVWSTTPATFAAAVTEKASMPVTVNGETVPSKDPDDAAPGSPAGSALSERMTPPNDDSSSGRFTGASIVIVPGESAGIPDGASIG